ncbi:MAG TPA: helix-turn-helix domain-containing protein [Terriglobia bacterium]|nr:helix-turn-helix domain-containing protein [Terriglobia bacterium]
MGTPTAILQTNANGEFGMSSENPSTLPLISPSNAWRILCRRTGIPVSRATFYRWLSNGKVYSVRLGQKIYIPVAVLDELIRQCRAGEKG